MPSITMKMLYSSKKSNVHIMQKNCGLKTEKKQNYCKKNSERIAKKRKEYCIQNKKKTKQI